MKKHLNRREILKGLSITGVGGALLAYQNCSNVNFGQKMTPIADNSSGTHSPSPLPSPNPQVCQRPLSIFDAASAAPMNPPSAAQVTMVGANPTGEAADHNPNATFYQVPYLDQISGNQLTAYLLTVDVGNSVTGPFHTTASNNTANVNILTDIYVIDSVTQTILLWKQIGSSEQRASAMFVLDPAWVAAALPLTVVVSCLEHGFFAQTVNLGDTPVDYSTAVGTWANGTAFGGADLYRPYVSVGATGGQGNVGQLHAPHFYSVTNNQVLVTLGNQTNKHPAIGENHYVAGGYLYDQNSNLIASISEQDYAQAQDHQLTFSGFDLAGRQVSFLRVVAMDTFNGIFQGFYQIP